MEVLTRFVYEEKDPCNNSYTQLLKACCSKAGEAQHHSVLLDDMGWLDSSVAFHSEKTQWNKQFQTPNMERLAKMGVKFSNAYADSVSSPSRVSLLTGTKPRRQHVTNWTLRKNTQTDAQSKILSFDKWKVNGFSPDASVEYAFYGSSLAQMLKNNGYTNLFVAKAHFAAMGTPAENPLNIGAQSLGCSSLLARKKELRQSSC